MAEEPDDIPIDTSPPPPAPRRKRRLGRLFVYGFLGLWFTVALWNLYKPLPTGVGIRGAIIDTPLNQLRFLHDVTSADVFGAPVVRQQIFDSVLELIGNARDYLVLDFFLFNSHRGAATSVKPHRELSAELRDALLARKREVPQLRILVIADPINDVYGGLPSRDLAALRDAGIDVVSPDLDTLRDSNAIYSAFWRLTLKWWSGDGTGQATLPNPLDAGPDQVSFGAWARLLNFKANHRKVIIGDDGKGAITGIVTSANPHDASSLHSNVALKLAGAALVPLLESELALATEAGWSGNWQVPEGAAAAAASAETTARVQVLTEGEIVAAILRNFSGARVGDSIDIAMFYLSERSVIQALLAAAGAASPYASFSIPTRTPSGAPRTAYPTARWPPSSRRHRTALSRCAGSERMASSSTASSSRCAPPRNSGSRSDRPISRAATCKTSISRPMWPRAFRSTRKSPCRSPAGSTRCGTTAARPSWNTPPNSAPTPIPRRAVTGSTA